jgi:hypothetical protein
MPGEWPFSFRGPSVSRRGDWIQTYSIGQFWPLDPRANEVWIADIAHSLSMMCRFTGHVHEFYSVAEHCVRVSFAAAERAATDGLDVALHARWGLLHDASEAYLVDLARPVKRTPEMAPYRDAEARIMAAVAERFGLGGDEPPLVKTVDMALCYTEARDLFPSVHPAWHWHAPPLPETIRPWSPRMAKHRFLTRFRDLWPHEVA